MGECRFSRPPSFLNNRNLDWPPPRPPARPRLCLQAGWMAEDAVVAAVAAAAVAAVAAGSKLPTSSPDRGMDG